MFNHYTGVGTRDLPYSLIPRVQKFAEYLATNTSLILRSGGADGNDSIHEDEFIIQNKTMEIYLPWTGFNNRFHDPKKGYYSISNSYHKLGEAEQIAMDNIGHWNVLKQGARKLHTRNVLQVLGADLNTPSQVVIYCTSNGKLTGGTRTAVAIANAYNIPTRDLYHHPLIEPREIFVFGSNLAGVHGAGAALHARQHYDAQLGVSSGFTGNAYAIPTKTFDISKSLPLEEINNSVALMKHTARAYPELSFKVTRIGCGLAGLLDKDIAPMFKGSPYNCIFDSKWESYLGAGYKYFNF